MSSRVISIAGIPVEVQLEGPVRAQHVDARFGAFTSCPWESDLPGWSLSARAEAGWSPPREVVAPLPGADVRWLSASRVELTRTHDLSVLDLDTRHAQSVGRPSVATLPVVDPTVIDTPLRFIASLELPRNDGLLMHASGFADERGAILFLAVSGGGKTTTARKLTHENVLSDDQVALRRIDGEWWAYALPFVGEYRRATTPRRALLRGLVLLARGDGASLDALRPSHALPALMRCVVNFVPGRHAAKLLDHVASLVAQVPVHRLSIARDAPMEPVLASLLDG